MSFPQTSQLPIVSNVPKRGGGGAAHSTRFIFNKEKGFDTNKNTSFNGPDTVLDFMVPVG